MHKLELRYHDEQAQPAIFMHALMLYKTQPEQAKAVITSLLSVMLGSAWTELKPEDRTVHLADFFETLSDEMEDLWTRFSNLREAIAEAKNGGRFSEGPPELSEATEDKSQDA